MSDKEDWKVGDRVQGYDDGNVFTGEVVEVIMAENRRVDYWSKRETIERYVNELTIKWDDSQDSPEKISVWDVDEEDTQLEREFRNMVPNVQEQIDQKLALAAEYLREAQKIADEHGVPFSSGISPLGQSYFPPSFEKKWVGVSKEKMMDITGTHSEFDECYGWVHSAVC